MLRSQYCTCSLLHSLVAPLATDGPLSPLAPSPPGWNCLLSVGFNRPDEMLFNVEAEMRQLAIVRQSSEAGPETHEEGKQAQGHMAGAVLAMETGASD